MPFEDPRLGHNGGPPLDDEPKPPVADWNHYCWKRARKRAWATPPIEIVRLRCERAEALGMTYKEYTAIVMDRGVYLQPGDRPTWRY
jgi:hypothetical protein